MIKIFKAVVLAVSVVLYYELKRLFSGNLKMPRSGYIDSVLKKKVPCSKLSFTYALSLFQGSKNSRMLLGLVQHLDQKPFIIKNNSMPALRLAEVALWEADIESYNIVKKYMSPSRMDNKRLAEFAYALENYYLWLIGEGDPPSLDGIFEGFFLFRPQMALMKAVFCLHRHNVEGFRKNIAIATYGQVGESQTSRKLKENAEKFSETLPSLGDMRHILIEG